MLIANMHLLEAEAPVWHAILRMSECFKQRLLFAHEEAFNAPALQVCNLKFR
jgi:hypothetical protein